MERSKKKVNKKAIIIGVLITTIVGVATYKYLQAKFSPRVYSGTIEATYIDLSAQVNSRIQKIYVKEGDLVNKNQALIDLSCEDIKTQFAQKEKDNERAIKLYKQGSLSQENFEHTKAMYDDMVTKLSWCAIKTTAENNFRVIDINFEENEFVSVGQKLIRLADLNNLWAYIYVAASELHNFSISKEIIINIPQLGDKISNQVHATVVHINAEPEFTPKNVQTREEKDRLVYGVKIKFNNIFTNIKNAQSEMIYPGMYLEFSL